MRTKVFLVVWLTCVSSFSGQAAIFSNVRGVVHDPGHRPVEGARVEIRAQGSDWGKSTQSDRNGEFQFQAVPFGEYRIAVSDDGFATLEQSLVVHSGSSPTLHFLLRVAALKQTVEVAEDVNASEGESSTSVSMVSRRVISQTPGADRTNSMAMITNYVPGATIVHDQLHIRGGHQVSWLVDGVPVPNTMIASNVGPQFDPKDIDYIEVQRGGYSAEYGDRTYGVFNVIPRSGFERNNEGTLFLTYGTNHETNDQFSFGSHTARFAYTASVNGNRSDLGLQTPTAKVLHGLASGLGGFASLIYNIRPTDQFRLVVSGRGDHYQVPNTQEEQTSGLRAVQDERDSFVNMTWVHTLNSTTMLTLSPFYHYNRASYEGGGVDNLLVPHDDRRASYAGAQISLTIATRRHNVKLGSYDFIENDETVFGVPATWGSGPAILQQSKTRGSLATLYAEDQFKVTSWLTLNGGVRLTRFAGLLSENAASPRVGAALGLPRLHWTVRGFYGRYYQAPPLSTVSGPLVQLATEQGFSFLPLHGERDEQREIGLTIPFRGWTIDTDYYHTNAHNFFDHDALGNSNIFLPLTIESARLRGWETTVRSPSSFHRAQFHLAFAHQYAEGKGGVTGGLTDFTPPPQGLFFLDHDQRDTLSTGCEVNLPGSSWAAGAFSLGSGFLNGDGPLHFGSHTRLDFSIGKSFRENYSVKVSVLNVTNARYLLDNSNTFGGTHFNSPREVSISLAYRFRY